MTHARQQAKQRYNDMLSVLHLSDLTMVHDISGEVSPDVTETMKEKKKLTKSLALISLDKEMDSLSNSWIGRNVFIRKRRNLCRERVELLNL